MSQYFTCPHCGADVPAKALACPACGSDDETGWSEEAKYVHLLPDHGDDTELPAQRKRRQGSQIIAAVLLLITVGGIYVSVPGVATNRWGLPALLLLAALGYAVYVLITRSPAYQERQLMQTLLTRVGGNQELAERLISYERRQNPIGDRAELIEAAISRLESDRR